MLRRRRPTAQRSRGTHAPRVAIIGTGFSGIAVAAELQRRGVRSFTLFEREGEVGGVWRDNTYPGAACDVVSHLYSFSWAPNPDWSRRYAPGHEIHAYLQRTARDRGLLPHCRFHAEVVRATWDDHDATWTLHFADGSTHVADVLVAGTGQLQRPAIPDLPGLADFDGVAFHSARWDHDVDLAGRDVVVVGTGASAIQFVPEVADVAGSVTVVQRSAPWIVAKRDRAYTATERRILAHVPAVRRAVRARLYAVKEAQWPVFAGDPVATRVATWLAMRSLRRGVSDPDLRRRLTPTFPIGCKRILQSNDWYPTLARPHVTLVDGGVARVERDAVVTTTGTRVPCDTIVFGTGFHATEFLAPIEVVGRDGRTLREAWRGGARAHLGISVPGFPDLFLLYGPNTNLGHNSIIVMVERQARYVGEAISRLRDHDLASMEVREDVERRYDDDVQRRLRDTVFAGGCDSWYRDATGRIVTNWVGTTLEYRWRTRRVDPAAHHLVRRRDLPTHRRDVEVAS